MVTDLNGLCRLTKAQVKPAAEMLARAFQEDPLIGYFFPDASERKNKLPYIFEFLIRYGVLYGEVYAISPNLEGVAVWLPSEKADISFWRMMRSGGLLMIPKISKEVIGRQRYFSQYVTPMHKRHAPFRHWVLHLIGVDPMFQGKGYAGKLLKPMLARIDEEGLSCYLETLDEHNVALYEHFNFTVIDKSTIPGTNLTNWAMLREKAD